MSQMSSRPTGTRRTKPPLNVYTVLSAVAAIALLGGIIFLWVRSNELFGTTNPFEIVTFR